MLGLIERQRACVCIIARTSEPSSDILALQAGGIWIEVHNFQSELYLGKYIKQCVPDFKPYNVASRDVITQVLIIRTIKLFKLAIRDLTLLPE